MMDRPRFIDACDFLDLFYVAAAGQDKAFIKTVEMVVSDTPTVNVVEVVRCKECLFYDGPLGGMCPIPTGTNPDFFCADGVLVMKEVST